MSLKISIVSGTRRPGSNTLKIASLIEPFYASGGHATTLLDLKAMPLECFAPEAYGAKPEAFVGEFSSKILDSDGVVIVVPEYNGSFPGVLKHFIDLLPFPESFEGRPVCFVGLSAGMWGGLRAVEQLQQIFAYRNAHLFPGRVFLPGIGGALDENGGMKDPELAGRLQKQAEGFLKFVQALKR